MTAEFVFEARNVSRCYCEMFQHDPAGGCLLLAGLWRHFFFFFSFFWFPRSSIRHFHYILMSVIVGCCVKSHFSSSVPLLPPLPPPHHQQHLCTPRLTHSPREPSLFNFDFNYHVSFVIRLQSSRNQASPPLSIPLPPCNHIPSDELLHVITEVIEYADDC